MEIVLIADRDLGFVFWLAERLHRLGCPALPAMTPAQAASMAEQFELGLLVIGASFPDSAAFIESVRRSRQHLRVLILPADHAARLEQVLDLEMALQRAPRQAGAPDEFGDQSESPVNRLAASRGALNGAVLGAALWALLIALVIPR